MGYYDYDICPYNGQYPTTVSEPEYNYPISAGILNIFQNPNNRNQSNNFYSLGQYSHKESDAAHIRSINGFHNFGSNPINGDWDDLACRFYYVSVEDNWQQEGCGGEEGMQPWGSNTRDLCQYTHCLSNHSWVRPITEMDGMKKTTNQTLLKSFFNFFK